MGNNTEGRMEAQDVEKCAQILAAYFANAIGTDFTGEPCTAIFPKDFGPLEQTGFRLIAHKLVAALNSKER